MIVNVTGRHVEITDVLRDHVHGRLEHALAGFPRVESAHVILMLEEYRQIAEIVLQAPNHVRVDAREESDDMYLSIDAAVEKAVKQVRKWQDRVQDHKAKEGLGHVDKDIHATGT